MTRYPEGESEEALRGRPSLGPTSVIRLSGADADLVTAALLYYRDSQLRSETDLDHFESILSRIGQ